MSKKRVAGYILNKQIGSGSYATVWRGRVEGGDEQVAVKVISRYRLTETAQLRQEVAVLRRISHPNIVRFKDLKKSSAHFYLVLEYCAGGDLSQFLKERGRMAEEAARRFLTQIAAGLCVLHRENVLHRDLKPQNILLSDSSDSPVLKIADFGFARALKPQDMAATVCGSPLYMAPEILRHEPYDAKADLWSVGAILYELLLGRPPFTGANPLQLLANIEKDDRVCFDGAPQLSSEGQGFLRALLMRSPAQRLTCVDFVQHPYVRLGPLANWPEAASQSTQGLVFSTDGSTVMTTCDWCVPNGAQGTQEWHAGGSRSPSEANSPVVTSPADSPREQPGGMADAKAEVSFELHCETLPSLADASATGSDAAASAPHGRHGGASPGEGRTAASNPSASADGDAAVRPKGGGERCAEEDFVVVAQQPFSCWARGRGRSSPRSAANSFCRNLSRSALALEQLALQVREDSPLDTLALLMRSLSLMEKALTVSFVEEETVEPLRCAFARIFGAAEACAGEVRSAAEAPRAPARPNGAIFDFAIRQAEEASAAVSKCLEVGGWDGACAEKLSLALLLLDLLQSEADGEDLSTIQAFTSPLARLVGKMERLACCSSSPWRQGPAPAAPSPSPGWEA